MHLKGGLDLLLSPKKIGYKPTLITSHQHEGLENMLNDPTNQLGGYKELQRCVELEYGKNMELLRVCCKTPNIMFVR